MSVYDDVVTALAPSSYYPTSDGIDAVSNVDMTLIGSPVAIPSLVPSDLGSADGGWQLDGSTQRLHIGQTYDFLGDWSMAVWLRFEQTTPNNFRRIFEKRDTVSPNAGFHIYTYAGTGVSELPSSFASGNFDVDYGASSEGFGFGPSFRPFRTRFVTWVWDNTLADLTIYYDGFFYGTPTLVTPITSAPGDMTFGAPTGGTGGNNFLGSMSKWAVWHGTKLTQANHEEMYAAGLGDFAIRSPVLSGG